MNKRHQNIEAMTTNSVEPKKHLNIEDTILPSTSIQDAFDAMKSFRGWSDSTVKGYMLDVHHFASFCYEVNLEPLLSTARLHLVTAWIKKQKDDGASISTINRRVASLSSIFAFFKDLGIVTSNPFKAAEVPIGLKGHHSRDLDLEGLVEVHHCLDLMKQDGFDVGVTVRVMLYTGLRNAALTELKVRDVNMQQEIIHYNAGVINSKHKVQIFPIPPLLLEKIQEHIKSHHLQPEDTLLNGLKGDPLRAKQLNRITDKICDFMGWKDDLHITPHGFRATIATILDEREVGRETIKFLLGHSDQKDNLDYYIRRHQKKIRRLRHELTLLEQEIEEGVQALKEGKEISQTIPVSEHDNPSYQKQTLNPPSYKISQEDFFELLQANKEAAMALFKQGLVAVQE